MNKCGHGGEAVSVSYWIPTILSVLLVKPIESLVGDRKKKKTNLRKKNKIYDQILKFKVRVCVFFF